VAHDTKTSLAARDGSYVLEEAAGEAEVGRTRFAKKFKVGPGRFRVGSSIGPIHYRLNPFDDTEPFKEIDLTVRGTPDEPWGAACLTNGYQVKFWQRRDVSGRVVRYVARYERAGRWLDIAPVVLLWENDLGQRQLISRVLAAGAPTIDNQLNQVSWSGAFGPGVDYGYNLRPDEFFKTLIINDRSSLPAPTISSTGLRLTFIVALSWGELSRASNYFASRITPLELSSGDEGLERGDEEYIQPETFSFQDEHRRDVWWMRRPLAWGSSEELVVLPVQWRLRRRGNFVFALVSVSARDLMDPGLVYPVYIDTSIPEEQVGASADDCERAYGTTGGFWLTSICQAGWYSATYAQWSSGFRFQTVPIPQGATIDSAKINMCSYANLSTTVVRTKLRCEDVDNAPAFSDITNWDARFPSGVTTEYVAWDGIPAWTKDVWYESPSFALAVQEVVGRAGWVSNNNLVVFWDDYDDRSDHNSNCRRQCYGYDIDTSKATKFNASYEEAAAGQPTMRRWGGVPGMQMTGRRSW